jgi:hypothetical protein
VRRSGLSPVGDVVDLERGERGEERRGEERRGVVSGEKMTTNK